MESYNNNRHSATKIIAAVNLYNAAIARDNLRKKYGRILACSPKYSVGDLVRISRGRRVFSEGYKGGWTIELFKISRIFTSLPPPVYYLRDLAYEDIVGYFYEEELCIVRKSLDS